MFPSQQRALRRAFKKADKFDHFRKRTRRSFVLGGIGAVVAAAGAFLAGLAVGSQSPRTDSKSRVADRWLQRVPWAERFAAQPIEILESGRSTFLMVIEETGGTDALWKGFERLAERALTSRGVEGVELARLLLRTCRLAPPPVELTHLVTRLEQLGVK
jgi:hypothetical protein